MKTSLSVLIIFFVVFLFQTITPELSFTTANADTTDVNPNGSSELSKLMREMQQYTKSAKSDINENKSAGVYPVSFDKIYTAKISNGVNKSEFYKQFADLYIASVKNYTTSTKENRVETYNNMVNACLACHSQHCPGPVPSIRKMAIEEKSN